MAEKKQPEKLNLVPIDKKKPERECNNCHTDSWWQREDGGWVCGVCHPKPELK